jgi:hypothetical protein
MPTTRLTMRKIREVLRLTFDCRLTKRQIAKSCAIARSTVAEYVRRFATSGLSWPLSPATDDEKLEQLLFPAGICGGMNIIISQRISSENLYPWPISHRDRPPSLPPTA